MYTFIPQDPPESLEVLAARYRFLEGRQSPDGSEQWLNWAVRLKSSRACIGYVQITLTPDRRAQLAYDIGVPYWRQGYATEACARVIKALFAEGVVEVWAELDSRNTASMRLLEQLGFERELSGVMPISSRDRAVTNGRIRRGATAKRRIT
jgi:RimJ/RimL family protein N-acetyltransferase